MTMKYQISNFKSQINTTNKIALHRIWEFSRKERGFTLIELLVVITIIGVLTTLVTTNFVGVRQRARDAQRKADIRQLQSALELFRTDEGIYPINNSTHRLNSTACPTSSSFTDSEGNGTVYMTKIPCDPLGSSIYNSGNYYYYSLDGLTYTLAVCLENTSDNDPNVTTTAPTPSGGSCSSGTYFVVTNP